MIIENEEQPLADQFLLVLEAADGVQVYKGIRCHGGYSKVYSLDAGGKAFLNREIYANGTISGITK